MVNDELPKLMNQEVVETFQIHNQKFFYPTDYMNNIVAKTGGLDWGPYDDPDCKKGDELVGIYGGITSEYLGIHLEIVSLIVLFCRAYSICR